MKPKPFWPLNHLTVTVGSFFPKAFSRVTITRFQIQLVDVFGKEPAGAFKKAQRLIEHSKRIGSAEKMQVSSDIPMRSGKPFDHLVPGGKNERGLFKGGLTRLYSGLKPLQSAQMTKTDSEVSAFCRKEPSDLLISFAMLA